MPYMQAATVLLLAEATQSDGEATGVPVGCSRCADMQVGGARATPTCSSSMGNPRGGTTRSMTSGEPTSSMRPRTTRIRKSSLTLTAMAFRKVHVTPDPADVAEVSVMACGNMGLVNLARLGVPETPGACRETVNARSD